MLVCCGILQGAFHPPSKDTAVLRGVLMLLQAGGDDVGEARVI